jgi:hypothetical protein
VADPSLTRALTAGIAAMIAVVGFLAVVAVLVEIVYIATGERPNVGCLVPSQ